MADSAEALIKKEPETPTHDPIVSRSTSGILLVCALLLTLSLAWALWDEAFGQRPWKGIQKEFVSRYTRYLKSIKTQAGKTEAEVKESAEYQQLAAEAQAALDQVKPETADVDKQVGTIQRQIDAVTDPFQNQRGRLTVISYNIETAEGSTKEKYRKEAERKRQEVTEVELPAPDGSGTITQKMNFEQLEKFYNDLREQKASLLAKKAELLKEPTEIAKKRDDYLKHHVIGLTPTQIDGLVKKMENFDYSILGHQISVNSANIVDRCEVCHIGIREPLDLKPADLAPDGPGKKPDSMSRAFVSHPNKELLQIHTPERFGCSGCHWGNGRATTGEVKGHGRHKYWLWPLFEKENIEAGCQQCHAKDRVTQGATTLNRGRDLFYERGCVGCHRYEGFDRETDALSSTRQNTTQLEDQILQNEKQIRQDTEAAGQAADDAEAQKLLAHAESLRVSNSLLAARIDQANLQSKYLMQDQKKIGPNLKDVKLKLRKEWIPVWLRDPQNFRPGTKMPTFWRFAETPNQSGVERDKDAEDQIRAISAYLWQESFEGKAPQQSRGNATHGQELFETRGCLGCHAIGDAENPTGGTFAANLQRIGEKSNFEYIVRWIHNPRDRWAPYCPKEKRDLTPEDYSKHGKAYAFDTELNSRCPNDGAELQVQNMTVMPNFRLSDSDTRDIATYLFSLSSPPSYPDASFMDDSNLKAQGGALIKQYGCAGCHEIKGFEDEQRIGKELTVEGATPIERLDFALLTHDAEKGHDPLDLRNLGRAPAEGNANTAHATHEEKPWYNHKGFFEHKLAEPAIYDRGKEKDPKDKLRMPKPFLEPEWRIALTTFLLGSVGTEGSNVPRSLFFDPQDQRRQDIQNGWWVIKKYNCVGCHQVQVGEKSVLMDVPYYQTPEGKDLLPPRLTSEGARVDPNWLLRFLNDPSLSGDRPLAANTGNAGNPPATASPSPAAQSGAPNPASTPSPAADGKLKAQPGLDRNGVRPYLKARMPTFNFSPNELQVLVRFFMALSGQQEPYIKEPLQPLTEQEKLVARQMFTSGTPCLKCHITGDPAHDATAIAPNFLLAGERLKPDWTFRWLLDPAQISPGTAMPSGLFRKEGERWVINLPNPPASATAYQNDHAQLLVRYMLLLTPEEQRRLLATSPVAPPAAGAPTAQKRGGIAKPSTSARSERKGRRGTVLAGSVIRRSNSRVGSSRGF
ncbi:MAG TPA: c-type cytochrome [Pyrinomonadaceae bacterium]|nr:c-type cytochrome [Pyrinomonadaceae bacterium]